MTNESLHSQIVIDQHLAGALQPGDTGTRGTAEVFKLLLPRLYGQRDKKQQPLEKVDHYMLLETKELYSRLQRYCEALGIEHCGEFKVARQGDSLVVLGDVPGKAELTLILNRDLWFVDSFIWLQPNYALLAHSFEMLEFSEYYERAPNAARQKYAHFEREDKGLLFALCYQQGQVNARVETPVNLYCV